MKKKRQFQKTYADRKIKLTGRLLMLLIILMFVIVLHDSFIHELPFYYILFLFGGVFIGRFVALTQKVLIREDAKTLTLKVRPAGLVITAVLLGLRYFAGKYILEEFDVVWAMDAVYLLFIGIYFAKLKNMLKQIDEQVYAYIFEKKLTQ